MYVIMLNLARLSQPTTGSQRLLELHHFALLDAEV